MSKYRVVKRRTVLLGIARTALGLLAPVAWTGAFAQRSGRPANRPSGGLSGRPLAPGRLRPYTTDGVTTSYVPGVFTVYGVRPRDNIVQLRDEDGSTADVYVDSDVFDLSTLSSGDEVAVDFFVRDDSSDRLEAASIWKLEPVKP